MRFSQRGTFHALFTRVAPSKATSNPKNLSRDIRPVRPLFNAKNAKKKDAKGRKGFALFAFPLRSLRQKQPFSAVSAPLREITLKEL